MTFPPTFTGGVMGTKLVNMEGITIKYKTLSKLNQYEGLGLPVSLGGKYMPDPSWRPDQTDLSGISVLSNLSTGPCLPDSSG